MHASGIFSNQGVRRGRILLIAAVAVLALVIITVVVFMGGSPFGQGPPNIILISIDTLRHENLGYAGHTPGGQSPSPFMDGLAREGAYFSHSVSTTTWTLPGHYSLLTGLPNELHEVVDDRTPCSPAIETMSQFLKSKGYATGGFFSGPYLHSFFGFHRGFDMYESCMNEDTLYDRPPEERDRLTKDQLIKQTIIMEQKSHANVTSRTVTDKALFFARTHIDEPMFLFLHYFDVHNDYIPPPLYKGKFTDPGYGGFVNGVGVVRDYRINEDMAEEDLNQLKGLYDGEIAWVDSQIQRFFDELEEIDRKILDRTIVVITSDHGEEFFEHGNIGHRQNLYGESLRIPLLIRAPGGTLQGRRIDDPVRIYDIYPTMVDLAGFAMPEGIYGRSLVPLLYGETMEPEPMVSELTFTPQGQKNEYHKYFSYQFKNFKYIGFQKRVWSSENPIDFTGNLLEEAYELYDLDQDPEEQNNLIGRRRKLADTMREGYEMERMRLQEFHKVLHEGAAPKKARDLSPEMVKRLQQEGYLGGGKNQSRKK